MSKKLTIQLKGSFEDNEDVRLFDFIDELNAVRDALTEIDKKFFGEGDATVDYRVVDLRHSSPSAVTIEPIPIDTTNDNANAVINRLLSTVQGINDGTALSDIDSRLLEKIGRIAAPYKRRVREVLLISDQTSVSVSHIFEANIARIVGEDQVFDGRFDGTLEVINLHRGANKFNIYPTVGPEKIICHFPVNLLKTAIGSVGQYIRVDGKIKQKQRDAFPYGIEVDSIEILPQEENLPSLNSIRGIAPDFSGGLSSVAFIRQLRND